MSEEHLVRIEAKVDAGFATVNSQLLTISKHQGLQEGLVRGHTVQIGWLWGLLTTGVVGGVLSILRSIM